MEGTPPNESLALEWLSQKGSQCQGMEEGTCQKVLPLPLPHIPPLWHPFLQSLQSYRRVCISFTISNDGNIALRLPTSSNIHFQPKFLPVLPTPRCWLDGHVWFATSLHLWCMHFSPWMLYLNKRLKVKNLRGSSQRYGLKLAMLN